MFNVLNNAIARFIEDNVPSDWHYSWNDPEIFISFNTPNRLLVRFEFEYQNDKYVDRVFKVDPDDPDLLHNIKMFIHNIDPR